MSIKAHGTPICRCGCFGNIGKLYRQQIDADIAYRSSLVKIPAPRFYVLYNGTKEESEYQRMKVSNAFAAESTSLELIADTYNINFSEGKKLLDSCYELKCYSIFVAKVREYLAEQQSLSQAIKNAIRYCRDNDLLAKYFAENEKEVFDMVTFKWDDKRANEIAREEGLAEGRAEGKKLGVISTLADLVKEGILTTAAAAKKAGMSEKDFRNAISS